MKLSPFYDIENITLYKNRYDTDLAMAIDDVFSFEKLGFYDFIKFCKDLDINLKGFVKEFNRVSNVIENSLKNDILADLNSEKKKSFFNIYQINVLDRIERLRGVVNYCLEYDG